MNFNCVFLNKCKIRRSFRLISLAASYYTYQMYCSTNHVKGVGYWQKELNEGFEMLTMRVICCFRMMRDVGDPPLIVICCHTWKQ
jgi:hypothetical protein